MQIDDYDRYVMSFDLSPVQQQAVSNQFNHIFNDPSHIHQDRDYQRYAFKLNNSIIISIEDLILAGGEHDHMVSPVNLSSCGIGIVHEGFLYEHTECKVYLPRLNGQCQQVKAYVSRCRLLHGQLYEIGLQFETPIELNDFVQPLEIENATLCM